MHSGTRLAERKRLFFFCNVGWFFLSHRLPLAAAAKADGYEVHLVCDVESETEIGAIRQAGLQFHRIRLSRGGINPFIDARTWLAILRLLWRYRPAVLHNVTIKPVLYGSLAARLVGTPGVVNAISGLGYVFIDSGRATVVRSVARVLYRLALNSPHVRVIFQNEDDAKQLVGAGFVRREQSVLIAGSGVDVGQFVSVPEPPSPPIRIVLPARMLADKGVLEFAGAARALKAAGFAVDCLLAGGLDNSNPAALSEAQLRALEKDGAVKWLGHVSDMPALLNTAHIVCLPSYREGLPKALIEACAAGRPIVTTDVPGCRDVVTDGVNGLLVPPREEQSLFAALTKLVTNAPLRAEMGARGREIAERRFDVRQVVERTLRLYAQLADA